VQEWVRVVVVVVVVVVGLRLQQEVVEVVVMEEEVVQGAELPVKVSVVPAPILAAAAAVRIRRMVVAMM